jgi:hypothetical protein
MVDKVMAFIIAQAQAAKYQQQPAGRRRQKVGIGQQFLRRIAAAAAGVQLPQVAQHAVEHEGYGRDQAARAVQGHGLGADRVQA